MCGNGGELFCCDEGEEGSDSAVDCVYSFCVECIQRSFGDAEVRCPRYRSGVRCAQPVAHVFVASSKDTHARLSDLSTPEAMVMSENASPC